ncbi:Anaerobic sulfatase-maturating enzyme [compost metagenome]
MIDLMRELSIMEFETSRNKYIMDGGTSRVIQVDDPMKFIIRNYYKFSKEVMFSLVGEISPIPERDFNTKYDYVSGLIAMGLFYTPDKIEQPRVEPDRDFYFKGNVSQLVLVVTEKCNLRCEYCIYSDKYPKEISYSNEEMDLETAKKAVDLFFEIHREKKRHGLRRNPAISFYGGEPLLNFALIQEIVEYAKGIDDTTTFYITTNGTLLNAKNIEFLVNNNILITFSLDGFKENHDRNRVFENGKPSFDLVLENIKRLQLRKKELNIERVISFNCCYDFYTDMSQTIDFFLENYDLFHPFFTYYNQINPFDTEYFDWCKEQERINPNWMFPSDSLERSLKEVNTKIYGRDQLEERYLEIVSMLLLSEFSFVIRDQNPRGILRNSCVPTSKIAVSPDGTIAVCEKMCKKHPIGNVNQGIDWEVVQDLTRKLSVFFQNETCSSCPVRAVCDACFMFMDEKGHIIEDYCNKKLKSYPKILSNLYSHLEEGVDYVAIYQKKREFSVMKESLI